MTRIGRGNGVLAALVLLSLLSACGFKLRGTVEIPPELNPMYLQGGAGALNRAILQRLEYSEVRLAPRPQDARITVRILNESRSSRVIAVDRDGKVLASELHYRVNFDAVGQDGKELVPAQNLDLVRTYENPDVEVLGKQLEADLIYEDLAQDAADRILDRLRAALL
jgi:LPS-assembly lipoprotein